MKMFGISLIVLFLGISVQASETAEQLSGYVWVIKGSEACWPYSPNDDEGNYELRVQLGGYADSDHNRINNLPQQIFSDSMSEKECLRIVSLLKQAEGYLIPVKLNIGSAQGSSSGGFYPCGSEYGHGSQRMCKYPSQSYSKTTVEFFFRSIRFWGADPL